MPLYAFRCSECGFSFDRRTEPERRNDTQECPDCGTLSGERFLTPVACTFTGDDWADKNLKIQQQMLARRERLAPKEEALKRNMNVRLAPNVNGEQVDTWKDAAKLAASKGLNTTGYEALAEKKP